MTDFRPPAESSAAEMRHVYRLKLNRAQAMAQTLVRRIEACRNEKDPDWGNIGDIEHMTENLQRALDSIEAYK